MPNAIYYTHNGEKLTAKQVQALKKDPASIDWVRRRLNAGHTVQQVLDEKVLTPSQMGRRGRAGSWWDKTNKS